LHLKMAEFQLSSLMEKVPEFEKLVLDRLSVKDISNLAKVNKKTFSLMERMAQRDHKKFETFVDRLSAAKLDEFIFDFNQSTFLIGENEAILRPIEDKKALEIFHFNAWKMIKFSTGWKKAAKNDTDAYARKYGGLLISESAKHMRAVFSVTEDKKNKTFLTIVAYNRNYECVQREIFEFSNHSLSKDSYKSYCKESCVTYNKGLVPVQIFQHGNKLCIKIVFMELTSDWKCPVQAKEKLIETSIDNLVHEFYTFRRFYLILCLKSVIVISKNVSENDYKVTEHKLEESPTVNCQVVASGIWLAINPKESSTYTLMHHKSAQKFVVAKFHPTNDAIFSMAEDAFDEDRVILLQRVFVRGPNTCFYQYKILLKNGDIMRNGMIDIESSLNQVDFGLYGRHLVALSEEELKIFDTFWGMERKLKNAPIKGGEQLAFTDTHLTFFQWDGEYPQARKLSFARPYPQLDNDEQ